MTGESQTKLKYYQCTSAALLYCKNTQLLTHWGQVTHICVVKLIIIGSDNGLLPGWRQAIIWTNTLILLIGPLGTNFSEILIAIQTFSFKKMSLKMASAKWRPFCLGLNVLNCIWQIITHGQTSGNRPVLGPRPVKTVEAGWKLLLYRSSYPVKYSWREPL